MSGIDLVTPEAVRAHPLDPPPVPPPPVCLVPLCAGEGTRILHPVLAPGVGLDLVLILLRHKHSGTKTEGCTGKPLKLAQLVDLS